MKTLSSNRNDHGLMQYRHYFQVKSLSFKRGEPVYARSYDGPEEIKSWYDRSLGKPNLKRPKVPLYQSTLPKTQGRKEITSLTLQIRIYSSREIQPTEAAANIQTTRSRSNGNIVAIRT